MLSGSGDVTGYAERAYYYDYVGRVIQTVEKNHLGGISRTSFKYDFLGNILTQHESHQKSSVATADILVKTFEYDHRSRLLSETTTLNTGAPAVVTYAYDELGKLEAKTYGSGSGAVTETYAYNIQGWLTEQSSSLFSMNLNYYGTSNPSYTGNITAWDWTNGGPANTYAFTYDKLSRLTNADHNTSGPQHTEKNITYDRNGNMLTLTRYGSSATGSTENMAFTGYDGNKLVSMTNNGTPYSYQYDANGNLTSDGLSGLKIEYNCLNLTGVAKDMFDDVKATYRWLADGTKVGVNDVAGTLGYEYMGSLVYHYVNGELQLEGAAFGGGRIMVAQGSSGATYTPNYFIADHLGSTRVIYDPAASAGSQIVARYDYMPFGQVRNATGLASTNRYKFSGKEEQTTGDLKFFDFGARFYNSRIGRWNGVDPLAGDYASMSPFNYCLNNPLRFIDPKGEDVYMFYYTSGNTRHGKPDPNADAMFGAAALTRAIDLLRNGMIKEGDAYIFRIVRDLGQIESMIESDIAEYSPQFGQTAEFSLWSHGALQGPIGTEATSGLYGIGHQMTPEGWGNINFNWKDDGAKAMFYGCRTGLDVNDKGFAVTPWVQTISGNANMHNVDVWGQTARSYPSISLSTVKSPYFNGTYPTYMVGAAEKAGDVSGVSRRLRIPYPAYPMSVYRNGGRR